MLINEKVALKKGTILIADSCAGGLDVMRYFLDWAGEYELCYLADGERNPFGLKNKSEIREIVIRWIENFKKNSKNLSLVVIACNTASISISEDITSISNKYGVPIITMIVGVKKSLVDNYKQISERNVLVLGTKFTINSNKYYEAFNELNPNKLYSLSATKTEKFIARGLEKIPRIENEVLGELSLFKNKKIETIFLGCTCFEFAKDKLKKLYGNQVFLLNPAREVSNESKRVLGMSNKKMSLENVNIYATGNLRNWKDNINIISEKIFNKKVNVKKINLA